MASPAAMRSSGMSRNAARRSVPSRKASLDARQRAEELEPRQFGGDRREALGRGVAIGERAERLGPKRERDGGALGRGELRHDEGAGAEPHERALALLPGDHAVEKIGRAEEGGDERRRRPAVQLLRRADLLEAPAAHHRDPVRDRQRLLLVVRHVDRGDAERLLQLADLAAHLDPELGVEIRERFVEQQHLGLDHQGSGDRDALELAAGELVRPARVVAFELDEAQGAQDAGIDLAAAQRPAPSGRRRRCRRRSGSGRWRSSGTPCRCCACAAAACRCAGRRNALRRSRARRSRRPSATAWSCRSRRAQAK